MSDDFNFDGTPARARGFRAPANIWDMLSILVLILTLCIIGYFGLIFINPQSSMNILQPGRGLQTPTNTPTPLQLEATWTPSPTLFVTQTNTPRPTFTPLATSTPFSLVPPTKTSKPTSTPKAPFSASQSQIESTVIHPEIACANWAGIGGTVVDNSNSHVIGIVVVLRGSLNGSVIEWTTVSGINKEYGQSGFEFVLGSAPVATNKTLYVQLVDQSNVPLSDPIYVTTSSECSKNLVLVRFKKTR